MRSVSRRKAAVTRLRIKICCISSIEEARLALDHGADLLGLVSAMPSGPGVIEDHAIDEIRAWVGSRAETVLLTSRTQASGIAEQVTRFAPDVVQLCDSLSPEQHRLLRERCTTVSVMPVVHVTGEASVGEAAALAESADALLLDSGRPQAAVRELGGTGRVHDWSLSRRIRTTVGIPVFLAGGLNAENVQRAVAAVRPTGVDVCSGVRVNGRLDNTRLADFVAAARC